MANVFRRIQRRILIRLVRLVQKSLIRYQYGMISKLPINDNELLFLNYGYLDGETGALTLNPEEEPFRTSIHLYHRTAALGSPQDKDVLEVGCGRGGGSAHIMRAFQPRSMTAIDLCASGIDFCRRHFASSGVRYLTGDAESIPLPDAAFDLVINVESSHCYPKLDRFLAEVHRVLRPGGLFCYTDFRARDQMNGWRAALAASGLEMIQEEDITAPVVAALASDNERKLGLIETKVPLRMRDYFAKFAAIEGAPLNTAFKNGTAQYWVFVMRKSR
ncbi:MAG: fatty-acid O-methyltransferase [Candidatus Hydrogenedentota bacterium]